MSDKIHNYHFGQWPEMPWKENKMILQEELRKYNISYVKITDEEWKNYYSNLYDVLVFPDDQIFSVRRAIESGINVWRLEEAKKISLLEDDEK